MRELSVLRGSGSYTEKFVVFGYSPAAPALQGPEKLEQDDLMYRQGKELAKLLYNNLSGGVYDSMMRELRRLQSGFGE